MFGNINMHIAMATNLSYHCELHVVLGIKPHQRSIREWTPYLSKILKDTSKTIRMNLLHKSLTLVLLAAGPFS